MAEPSKTASGDFQLGLMLSVANPNSTDVCENVYTEISTNFPDSAGDYRLDAKGGIVAASIEYVVLLSAVGSVASVASLLWQAYDKWIAPKKDRSSLYVCIDPQRDLHWMLGDVFKDKDTFVADFTQRVEGYIKTEEGKARFVETKRLVEGHLWVSRKKMKTK